LLLIGLLVQTGSHRALTEKIYTSEFTPKVKKHTERASSVSPV
jgi:hypothetical protein